MAPCPCCGQVFVWEVDLRLDREIAWSNGNWPTFGFLCAACQRKLLVAVEWQVEAGAAARRLTLIGRSQRGLRPVPGMLLVAACPHGCGTRLGLRLDADDPWALAGVVPDRDDVLGGYRCPRCDGEGRLRVVVRVAAAEAGCERQPGEV